VQSLFLYDFFCLEVFENTECEYDERNLNHETHENVSIFFHISSCISWLKKSCLTISLIFHDQGKVQMPMPILPVVITVFSDLR